MLLYITGLLLSFIFVFLSAIHFYWGFGGTWAIKGSIPTKENNEKVINPKFFACFTMGFIFLSFGFFVLAKSRILSFRFPGWLMEYGTWGLCLLFMMRAIGEFKYVGFFKKIKSTEFAQMDTKYYSPLCLVVGLLAMTLALLK